MTVNNIVELPSNILDKVFAFAQTPELRETCKAYYSSSKRPETRGLYLMHKFLCDKQFHFETKVPLLPRHVLQHATRMANTKELKQSTTNLSAGLMKGSLNSLALPKSNSLSVSYSSIAVSPKHTILTVDVLKQLVLLGADLHGDNHHFLRWACTSANISYLQMLETMSSREKFVLSLRIMDDTPIRLAAQHGSLDVVKYLVKHGAEVHSKRNFPMRVAIQYGYEDLVKWLITTQDCDLHMDDDAALNAFCGRGNTDMAQWLIERASLKASKKFDRDALDQAFMTAYMAGQAHVLEYLLTLPDCLSPENQKLFKMLGVYVVST